MRRIVAWNRFEQVIRSVGVDWFMGLLAFIPRCGKESVPETWHECLAIYCLNRRPSHIQFPARMLRYPHNCACGDLRLKDWRHRLGMPGQPCTPPTELRS